MTRRMVVFIDKDGTRYVTGELNGDKSEFARFHMGDVCTKDWAEIAAEFQACQTLDQFRATYEKVQGYYQSALGKQELLPVQEMPVSWVPQASEVLTITAPHIDVSKNPRFSDFFSLYCMAETEAGRCPDGACETCCVNQAYMTIFDGKNEVSEDDD